jgi:hypothetical protein
MFILFINDEYIGRYATYFLAKEVADKIMEGKKRCLGYEINEKNKVTIFECFIVFTDSFIV